MARNISRVTRPVSKRSGKIAKLKLDSVEIPEPEKRNALNGQLLPKPKFPPPVRLTTRNPPG